MTGDFYEGPQNNLARVVHALRRNDYDLCFLQEAVPVGQDLLEAYGPNLSNFGGEIRDLMTALEIGWDDISTQNDLIALVELANTEKGKEKR